MDRAPPKSTQRRGRPLWASAFGALREWLFPVARDPEKNNPRLGDLVLLEDRALLSATPLRTENVDLILANAATTTSAQLRPDLANPMPASAALAPKLPTP